MKIHTATTGICLNGTFLIITTELSTVTKLCTQKMYGGKGRKGIGS